MPKFDDQENKKLNKNIKSLVNEMTKDLKNCEVLIKEIINDTNNNIDLDLNNLQIKKNLKQNILTKLNDFTKKFKINQELYNSKFNDLVCDEDLANISMRNKDLDLKGSNDFLATQENNEQLKKRDNELNNLLESVNELAQLFKDMQTLVMEQGTILDRIDYNIDIASTNISTGKKSIIKADKHLKNNCFRNVIIVLLICIFIEGLLIIFKFI
jgi:syntaxin 16